MKFTIATVLLLASVAAIPTPTESVEAFGAKATESSSPSVGSTKYHDKDVGYHGYGESEISNSVNHLTNAIAELDINRIAHSGFDLGASIADHFTKKGLGADLGAYGENDDDSDSTRY